MSDTTDNQHDLFDVIEIDRLTGNERLLLPFGDKLDRNEAENVVTRRTGIITARYGYRIVPTGTWED